MAANTYKKNTFKKKETPGKPAPKSKRKFNWAFFNDKRWSLSFGILFLMFSVFMFLAFLSYLFVGQADQSLVNASGMPIRTKAGETQNLLGYTGAVMSYFMIYRWFGIAALFFPPFLFFLGYRLSFKNSLVSLTRYAGFSLFFLVWLGLLMGYLVHLIDGYNYLAFLSGGFGYELAMLSDAFLGWGTFILIFGSLLIFVIVFFNVDQITWFNGSEKETSQATDTEDRQNNYVPEGKDEDDFIDEPIEETEAEEDEPEEEEEKSDANSWKVSDADKSAQVSKKDKISSPAFKVEDTTKDGPVETEDPLAGNNFVVKNKGNEEKTAEMVENLDPYDPTLDLPSYQFPTLTLLNEYDQQKVTVTRQELEENKNKIVETLINFKIGIQEIKATIGPTVTLYEIIPEPGVKISKIKNLEDDIALSLAALGIRIIAPIPGKGTIGIEVPNKNRELVAARSVLGTEKFMKSDKELPVALGKTISNEVFVVDLAKMPHLLMAGATGQGKSVGLNMILASLIYKKHPSQLKLILVDPKKVELTLFNKIERHFLAKLPNAEEAIITDTKKVIYTLNSLCIEMDNRYDLLKDAGCRNLKEYNAKFVARKLNPDKGHKFMPYIVLVIDELADLMMTAGKEIEGPIARLAQLARAIGIHLVLATQRPSVNVITGIIKANFPARLSFRVTSKIDSRTILDAGGAEQLIGMGDMLLSMGSDVIRLQCAFLDTPEVDAVCDWIGDQRGYSDAYLLPEFVGEEGDSGIGEVDLSERDALFDDAARLIVMHQQGSTSLIQRKLKLGYNRAGRIIDQLEAAGIVGAFEGSKAREVLVQDENTLEQLLNNL
ncbi:DNA translocase FtsK 4TM domain-containing protein [Cyclobacterium sp. 1_MG-2023]|uniref:FtsK/SpoIIIE family DNA translocase n=1 Tax=Cyclobacterium sp. 1_MG-2023 TaxID=3062681 RepID=UPI0026E3663E|nr:DNA translocase FtsK [Cyclobacterium sp. 1_MG-2023]MDO6438755.1 DNA translocase FtsK 4TM domain-containing protein [Cyclobacterium sp. 1_MG-2023]